MRQTIVLTLALASASLGGCAAPGERAGGPSTQGAPTTEQRELSPDELRRLRELADAVVVGTVESIDDPETGRLYTVRVTEVLARHPDVETRKATHPMDENEAVKVTAFLFRPGAGNGEIGALEELSRYVFFLSPTEDAGEWLNLEDAAAQRLPEAQGTLDHLRALRDKPPASGAPASASD